MGKECRRFRFNNIIKVCSTRPGWKSDITSIQLQERICDATHPVSYVVIVTYASFAKDYAFDLLNSLSPKTLLIADEAHNMGSGALLHKLPMIRFKRRIGLSATPDRQFDDEGNAALRTFLAQNNDIPTSSQCKKLLIKAFCVIMIIILM